MKVGRSCESYAHSKSVSAPSGPRICSTHVRKGGLSSGKHRLLHHIFHHVDSVCDTSPRCHARAHTSQWVSNCGILARYSRRLASNCKWCISARVGLQIRLSVDLDFNQSCQRKSCNEAHSSAVKAAAGRHTVIFCSGTI